jgi:elongation factor G
MTNDNNYLKPLPFDKIQSAEFSNQTVGTAIPYNFMPAIKKGFLNSLERGALTGSKVTGIHFRLKDGN